MVTKYRAGALSEEALSRFTCTQQYWRSGMPWHPFLYSDGVQYVVEQGGAYWLLDVIGSWQAEPKVRTNEKLQELQFWTLEKAQDSSAVIRCEWDEGKVVVEQAIECTDFPLAKVQFYLAHMWRFWEYRGRPGPEASLAHGVLLLHSEY